MCVCVRTSMALPRPWRRRSHQRWCLAKLISGVPVLGLAGCTLLRFAWSSPLPYLCLRSLLEPALLASVSLEAAGAEQLQRYREADPSLPGFEVLRPSGSGWSFEAHTLTQRMWYGYGRSIRFSRGNISVSVALQPVDTKKRTLSELGSPADFARAFVKSASLIFAPPSTATPSPVPKVMPLSMDAAPDLCRVSAKYQLEVEGRPSFIFQQLVGLGNGTDSRTYLYSLTGMAPESEFGQNEALFADIFQSFRLPEVNRR